MDPNEALKRARELAQQVVSCGGMSTDELVDCARDFAWQMTRAERFFYTHAGYSYDPKTESEEQGRSRCAKQLAWAERYAQLNGWSYEWKDDDVPWDADGPEPRYLLGCILRNASGTVLASLWHIGLNRLNDPYRRVVEAELALEAMP